MAPGSPWWASAMALSDSAYDGANFSPSWQEPDDPVKMLSRVGSEGKYKPLTTCQATANAPTINTTSTKVSIQRIFNNRLIGIKDSLRAYHRPSEALAANLIIPIGNKLVNNISAKPPFNHQKAVFMSLSSNTRCGRI